MALSFNTIMYLLLCGLFNVSKTLWRTFILWFDHFSNSRAEIFKLFHWYFGPNGDSKRTFWNKLTFSSLPCTFLPFNKSEHGSIKRQWPTHLRYFFSKIVRKNLPWFCLMSGDRGVKLLARAEGGYRRANKKSGSLGESVSVVLCQIWYV